MKNTNSTIDYSVLNSSISSKEIQNYIQKINPYQHFRGKNFMLYALVAVYVLITASFFAVKDGEILGLIVGFSGGCIIILLYLYEKSRIKQSAIMYRFAMKNNMSFIQGGGKFAPGMIFDEGHSRQVTSGYILENGMEIANYRYTIGHGKNSQTLRYAYVEIPLKRRMPHMVLDAKSNNFMKLTTGLPDTFNKSQTLSLEGNFDKFFTLYTPEKYERDALYVFTPDVMAKLIDECKQFDVEIVDNKMYLYRLGSFKLQDARQLKSMFGVIETISSELQSQTKRYADERVVDARDTDVVSSEGQRLKKSQTTAFIATIFIIIGIMIQIFM